MMFSRIICRVLAAAALVNVCASQAEALVPVRIANDVYAFIGAAAFEEAGATLAAQRETIDLIKARCAHCLDNLRQILGAEATGGDPRSIALPQR